MSKHTKGPWKIHPILALRNQVLNSDGKLVAVTVEPQNETDTPNAVLISAAPDLLAACESALELFEKYLPDCGKHGTVPYLKHAIKKAKGEA